MLPIAGCLVLVDCLLLVLLFEVLCGLVVLLRVLGCFVGLLAVFVVEDLLLVFALAGLDLLARLLLLWVERVVSFAGVLADLLAVLLEDDLLPVLAAVFFCAVFFAVWPARRVLEVRVVGLLVFLVAVLLVVDFDEDLAAGALVILVARVLLPDWLVERDAVPRLAVLLVSPRELPVLPTVLRCVVLRAVVPVLVLLLVLEGDFFCVAIG